MNRDLGKKLHAAATLYNRRQHRSKQLLKELPAGGAQEYVALLLGFVRTIKFLIAKHCQWFLVLHFNSEREEVPLAQAPELP